MATKNIKDKVKGVKADDIRTKAISAYINYFLINGKQPASVYAFCQESGMSEDEFYNEFSSFESLEAEVWSDLIIDTVSSIQENKEYNEYGVSEKLLAFYYTLIEVMKQNRSFILSSYSHRDKREVMPRVLKGVRKEFKLYVGSLIEEGMNNEEIKKRPYLSDKYDEALWIQFLFVLHFWIKDDSKGFEQTDAAIEKAVKLSSELMSEGPIDSFIDLAKFIIQNSR